MYYFAQGPTVWGYGDLVCIRIYFPKSLVVEFFPYYTKPLYGRYFLARYFSPKINLHDIFFWNALKVNKTRFAKKGSEI